MDEKYSKLGNDYADEGSYKKAIKIIEKLFLKILYQTFKRKE